MGQNVAPKFHLRVFWGCLSATLFIMIVTVSVYAHLGISQDATEVTLTFAQYVYNIQLCYCLHVVVKLGWNHVFAKPDNLQIF